MHAFRLSSAFFKIYLYLYLFPVENIAGDRLENGLFG